MVRDLRAILCSVFSMQQVNYSMMVGAIISWGIAWPLLRNRAGDWYPANLANPANNFQGEFAYHVSAFQAYSSVLLHSLLPCCCIDCALLAQWVETTRKELAVAWVPTHHLHLWQQAALLHPHPLTATGPVVAVLDLKRHSSSTMIVSCRFTGVLVDRPVPGRRRLPDREDGHHLLHPLAHAAAGRQHRGAQPGGREGALS